MPTFVTELSDLPPELKPLLPPTDSRLRQDVHLLQHGLFKQVPVPPLTRTAMSGKRSG